MSSGNLAQASILHVATSGNDQWSGKLATPNAKGTDGPLATLVGARDAIRKLKQHDGLPYGGVIVLVHGGIYSMDQTFELTKNDSGTESAPIVYRASPGQEVRLLGGKLVKGFQPVTDSAIRKRLDQKARDHILQADLKSLGITNYGSVKGGGIELFFQDKPMTLARWPNEEFVRIVDVVGGKPFDVRGNKGDRIGKFVYEGDRPKRWKEENDAWVHGYWFWDWSDQRQKVESIDLQRRVISVVPPYHNYGYRKGQWFYGLNLLAELDRPGEWYLDRKSGVLYFWPPAAIEQGNPMVSVLSTMISMRDTSYVTVSGMTIEAVRADAIKIEKGDHVCIAGCTLRNLGGWAVRVSGGTLHRVVSCDVYEVGKGGISLAGGVRKTLTPAGHVAENNHIHHYGRWLRMYQSGIALSGVGNVAVHNLIHTAPHIAIIFGGNDHRIELNEIHHVCEESNDAGAIYAGRDWSTRGTVIQHNFLHHINGFKDRGCVGVYLDDLFSGTNIVGNVFYKVTRAAFIGGGRDCRVDNNLFIDCTRGLHIDARGMGWAHGSVESTMIPRLKAMPYKNLLWSKRYPQLLTLLGDEPASPKGNLIIHNASQGGTWNGVTKTAKPYIAFKENLFDEKDIRCVDMKSMNFQLRDDSPVYKKMPGFKKIPFDKIGLVDDQYRTK